MRPKQLPAWFCLKGEFCVLCPPAHQHEHEPSSELSKQSLLLSESDYDGSPRIRPHVPSPLASSHLVSDSPPGYVWYIELAPPHHWKYLAADIKKHVAQTLKSPTPSFLRLFQQAVWSWNLPVMSKIHIRHTTYQSTWIALLHHHISQRYGEMDGKVKWLVILSMTTTTVQWFDECHTDNSP